MKAVKCDRVVFYDVVVAGLLKLIVVCINFFNLTASRASLVTLLIALMTISFQTLRAARSGPVKTLREAGRAHLRPEILLFISKWCKGEKPNPLLASHESCV